MKNKKQQSRQLAKCLEAMRKGKSSAEDYMTQYPHIAAELKLATALMAESQVLFEAEQDHARKRMIRSKVMSNLENRTFAVTNSKDSRYILHNLKRRFAMSWIIILTTVLSLVSGGGIVYASGNALPGEMLYPVKTWVEDVRLAVASNGTDVGLHFKFTENRMYEIRALLENGEIADLQAGLDGYENHARLLAQTMAKIQAQDPEQATRLRADLESKLHEQARRMEEWMADPEESDPYSQERLRTMLQTNTQLRERIHEIDVLPDENDPASEDPLTDLIDESQDTEKRDKKQNGAGNISAGINGEANAFQFNLDGAGKNGVYAVVSGTRFECELKDSIAVCSAFGAPGKGSVQLYDQQTNQLLFSYAYEHAFAYDYSWQGEKNETGDHSGAGGEGEHGENHNKNG